MMQEEAEPIAAEPPEAEEIAEDTPNYLNPEVFEKEKAAFDYDAEEAVEDKAGGAFDDADIEARAEAGAADFAERASEHDKSAAAVFENQPPEKMEEVLNQGVAFIGGLLEMATGKNSRPAAGMIR